MTIPKGQDIIEHLEERMEKLTADNERLIRLNEQREVDCNMLAEKLRVIVEMNEVKEQVFRNLTSTMLELYRK